MRSYIVKMILTGLAAAVLGGCAETSKKHSAAKTAWDKSSVKIKLPIAQQQYASGKYQEALKTVNDILAVDKNCAPAHLLCGKVLLTQGMADGGVEEVKKAVGAEPGLSEGWFILGSCAEQKKDWPGAANNYRHALDLMPASTVYAIALARAMTAQGNAEDARKLLDEKIAADPADSELKVQAAQILERQGRLGDAISLYKQARLLQPNDTDIAESLGYCYVLNGNWLEAAGVFEQIINNCKDQSRKTDLTEMLAMCEMNANQFARAEKHYSELTANKRDDAQAWLRMGQAALGAGAAQRAFVCSQRAIALEANNTQAILLQGCSEFMSGQFASARITFERITSDREHGSFAWLMIGKCCSKLGDAEGAKDAYKRALTYVDPAMADYLAKLQN